MSSDAQSVLCGISHPFKIQSVLLLLPVLSVILKVYKYRCLHSCLIILSLSVRDIPKISHLWGSWAYNAGSRKTSHLDVRIKAAT